ncbi:hypothetical protein [Rhizobium sp. SL42]|uniref:hypothetical protein n=1 Tax=Rhizobium sp. SL42 TaxID=2806346 RepID=UPI001F1FBCA3|nr:hypothetical protein [Rhizobium sp. SL42]UJW74342.1 hypothetical protein IM739_15955 [Rhizobium sp. SL42]
MTMKFRYTVLAAFMALAGCTTTEEAQQVIQSRWIGQPIDSFFIQYGPPISQYPLASGTIIYTWRGGDRTRYIPPTYTMPEPARTVVRTETRQTGSGQTVTQTRVIARDPGWGPEMISPPQYQQLFCELQITADKSNNIMTIRASNDTDGEGLSLSRCAEVLDAHPKK